MPRFFIDAPPIGKIITISGADAHHICHVLRMHSGDALTICDAAGTQYDCVLVDGTADEVLAQIHDRHVAAGESDLWITLYMALPKADKMEFVVQKSTELGVCEIVPFLASRCVSRPDAKTLEKKTARWNKIAAEASKQCARGRVPLVRQALSLKDAVRSAAKADTPLLLYEAERVHRFRDALRAKPLTTVSLMVGPEGGFDEDEAAIAVKAGLISVSLGTRILRCETAPIAALAAVQYESGNL